MKLNKIYTVFTAIVSILSLVGCIHNDLPYPTVRLAIESIEVEGTSGPCVIDAATNTVTIPLLETTDIRNVEIVGASYTEKARLSEPILGKFDLRTPKYITLSLY
ncbi:MAG: hypothetical protein II307_04095, partial [Alistipes sp.]|nr:hypothetical protein [Alistipes sp.]